MENNSRTEMLPGKRGVAPHIHVNKEFWQQFQNYAPPSLQVIRTKFARTIYNSASEAKLTNRRENFKISNQKVMKISIV